jgi:site-specific DNA-methyltransferase (adenine-specific)
MISEVKNMDCMDYMKQFPDKFFDLAVVDPPYGINMDGGVIGISRKAKSVQYTKKSWDSEAPDESYFKELQRVSKNQIIFGANHFISRIPLDSSCWIVWNKENGDNPFADCELAWTSFKTAVRMFTFRWQGMLQGNMKHKEIRIHPTQKPVALYAWIFKNFSRGGRKFLIHTWEVAAAELQHIRWDLTSMAVNLIKNTLTKWKQDFSKNVMVLR